MQHDDLMDEIRQCLNEIEAIFAAYSIYLDRIKKIETRIKEIPDEEIKNSAKNALDSLLNQTRSETRMESDKLKKSKDILSSMVRDGAGNARAENFLTTVKSDMETLLNSLNKQNGLNEKLDEIETNYSFIMVAPRKVSNPLPGISVKNPAAFFKGKETELGYLSKKLSPRAKLACLESAVNTTADNNKLLKDYIELQQVMTTRNETKQNMLYALQTFDNAVRVSRVEDKDEIRDQIKKMTTNIQAGKHDHHPENADGLEKLVLKNANLPEAESLYKNNVKLFEKIKAEFIAFEQKARTNKDAARLSERTKLASNELEFGGDINKVFSILKDGSEASYQSMKNKVMEIQKEFEKMNPPVAVKRKLAR
jgi:hypothetical protein